MEAVQPYLKYILYLFAIIGFLWTNRIFIQDIELRRWVMQSFEDDKTGRASGKSLSAFISTSALILGWLIAIHYGDNHTAPEYYFWGLLGLVTSLYGIKEVGKVATAYTSSKNGNGNGNGNGNAHEESSAEKIEKKKASDDAELKKRYEESKSELPFEEWAKEQI